jgi:hypothetical protein
MNCTAYSCVHACVRWIVKAPAIRCRAAVCRGFGIVFVRDANATYTEVRGGMWCSCSGCKTSWLSAPQQLLRFDGKCSQEMHNATLVNIECGAAS